MGEINSTAIKQSPFILSPIEGSTVDYQAPVRIAVPEGVKDLRLFVYADDDRWYLQSWPSPTDLPKVWQAIGTFGNPDSVGRHFKLIAIISNAAPSAPLTEEELPPGPRSNIVSVKRTDPKGGQNEKGKLLAQIAGAVALCIFSAMIGVIATNANNDYTGRIRHLPYLITANPGMIPKPDFGSRDFKILLDNEEDFMQSAPAGQR